MATENTPKWLYESVGDGAARRAQRVQQLTTQLAELARQAEAAYAKKLAAARAAHHLPQGADAIFLEVVVEDYSEFEAELTVHGITRYGYKILEVHGPAVPNAIAAVLLHIRDVTGLMPTSTSAGPRATP